MRRTNLILAAGLLLTGCEKLGPLLGSIFDGSGGGGGGGHPHHPDAGQGEPPSPPCGFTIGIDDLYAEVHADLVALDPSDRIFSRYLTLANRSDAGVCGADLDRNRSALNELLNATSLEAVAAIAIPIDPEALTYRFDLRDYAWDRPIDAIDLSFADGWEAVSGLSPFSIEYTGVDADAAKALSGTRVPLLAFDAFAGIVTRGDVYSALTGVPADIEALLAQLDVDVDADVAAGASLRAGIDTSNVSRQPRIIERFPLPGQAIGLWRAQDFLESGGQTVFTDPLRAEGDGSLVFYPLPNGLLAFGIFDADGSRVDASELILDFNQRDFFARAPASCMNCHATGSIAFEDAVRPFVESHPGDFDADVVSKVQEIYPTASAALDIVQDDSRVYRLARLAAGVSTTGPDPAARAVMEFDLELESPTMAGDFLVSPAAFEAQRSELPPGLSQPSIDRNEFAAVFGESLCILLENAANQPVGCQ